LEKTGLISFLLGKTRFLLYFLIPGKVKNLLLLIFGKGGKGLLLIY